VPSNQWQIGALYPPGGRNNIAWSQPGGIGSQVFPQQVTSTEYFQVTPFSELSGMMSCGCGHFLNTPLIQREYDYNTNSSVALLCCPLCGYVNSILEPFESALSTVSQPQIVV
jgi:hypothetical protein